MIMMDDELRGLDLPIRLGLLKGKVRVRAQREDIATWVEETVNGKDYGMIDPKSVAPIAGGRKLYRALGKDPSRYRLSSEALMRRIKKARGLYLINDLVDVLNCFSLETGFPVGLYDLDRIDGPIVLRAGTPEDDYQGLGKGSLNVDRMPVLSDGIGPFGSPTSDTPRTAITDGTTAYLLVIFAFGDVSVKPALDRARRLMAERLDVTFESEEIVASE